MRAGVRTYEENGQMKAAYDVEAASGASNDAVNVWDQIKRLGLEYHIAELDALGLTVIPRDKVNAQDLVDDIRSTTRRIVEQRLGRQLDWEGGEPLGDRFAGIGQTFYGLALEDPVYQRMVLNPVALAFADYCVGRSCHLATCLALLKSSGKDDLKLHTDNLAFPGPFPAPIQSVNVTWPLSDYTKDGGPLCYVPGSHRQCRPPFPGEADHERVPVEAEAGSLIIWNGATWHGAFARKSAGYRLNVVTAYSRSYILPQERYMIEVTREILDANPPRFATLMGQDNPQFSPGGYDSTKRDNVAGNSWWD